MKRTSFWRYLPKARYLGGVLLLGGIAACSPPTSKEVPSHLLPAPVSQAFILGEVYSDKYCFRHHYYWKDSLANVRDICRVRAQFEDSVNHVLVELHGWTGKFCETNRFLLIRQRQQAWFVPLCDEQTLQTGTWRDTTFFRDNLVVTKPLNTALRGLILKDRSFFLTGLFALSFHRQVTRANYNRASYTVFLDARTQDYLRLRLTQPQRYYYRVESGGEHTLWEFDDTHRGQVKVRVIRPTWYRCFAM